MQVFPTEQLQGSAAASKAFSLAHVKAANANLKVLLEKPEGRELQCVKFEAAENPFLGCTVCVEGRHGVVVDCPNTPGVEKYKVAMMDDNGYELHELFPVDVFKGMAGLTKDAFQVIEATSTGGAASLLSEMCKTSPIAASIRAEALSRSASMAKTPTKSAGAVAEQLAPAEPPSPVVSKEAEAVEAVKAVEAAVEKSAAAAGAAIWERLKTRSTVAQQAGAESDAELDF